MQRSPQQLLRTSGGINKFFHFKDLTQPADHWVVSPNNDTIYSMVSINASQGFTLKLPDVGKRYMSVQIITENGVTPFYLYGGGVRHFKAEDFDTNFVALSVRVATDGTPEDIKEIVQKIQPQFKIEGAATDASIPKVDMATLLKVRKALLPEYNKLPNIFGVMQKRTQDVKDWERFTYVTAGAWGLAPDADSMYAAGRPEKLKGGTCYKATFPKVPVKAFFSVTVYEPDKYLMISTNNIVSSNRGVKTNKDGSFDVAFGGKKCSKLAANYAATPKDGWSFILRTYRPDVEAFKHYKMPSLKEVK